MCKAAFRIIVTVGLSGLLLSVNADDKADKKKAQIALQRAQKAEKAGRRDEALVAYTDVLAADPFNPQALRARAKLHIDNKEAEKALPDIEEAVRLQPGDPQNFAARGDYFMAAAQPERAIQDYTTAIGLKLERADVYTHRGEAYLSARKFDLAIEDFNQGIKLR